MFACCVLLLLFHFLYILLVHSFLIVIFFLFYTRTGLELVGVFSSFGDEHKNTNMRKHKLCLYRHFWMWKNEKRKNFIRSNGKKIETRAFYVSCIWVHIFGHDTRNYTLISQYLYVDRLFFRSTVRRFVFIHSIFNVRNENMLINEKVQRFCCAAQTNTHTHLVKSIMIIYNLVRILKMFEYVYVQKMVIIHTIL